MKGISLPTASHRTETALLHVTACLLESTDQGRVSVLSLLDLSAAFDSPGRSIFLERLHTTFGISGSALQWLRSYILNRSQVVVNGVLSNLDFGVPQVSVLGPMLFVFYTQPISLIVCQRGCELHKFSDNAQLFSSAPSADLGTRIRQTEQCVEHVKAWMDSNKLKLNSDKTEAVVVGTLSRTSASCGEHLEIGGSLIPFQSKVENLGVVLDSSHIICEHINSVCHSAYNELRRVSSIHSFLTKDVTTTLDCTQFFFLFLGLIITIPFQQASLQSR